MSVCEEFKSEVTDIFNKQAANKEMALWDGLLDKLMELAVNLFDSCISQLSPAQVGENIAGARDNVVAKARFRKRVKKEVYDGDDKRWKEEGGQNAADGALQAFKNLGPEKCKALAVEMTSGDNFWPNEFLFMG